jgi:hypothetical protein
MPAFADRVKESSTTTGTGTLTLDGAATGFQTFSGAFGNSVSVYYVIAGGSQWEVGIGTTGAGTLSRDTVLQSSNADALVDLAAGTKDVFCSYVADRAVTTVDAATLTNKAVSGQVIEKATVSATAATGTINYNVSTQAVLFYTSNATGNWTLNLRGSSTVSMNTLLAVGDSITLTFLVQQGTTPYYPTAHQIDGTSATVRWQGGTAPTAGNASSIDIYTYTIIKTAATPTYTLLGSQTRFA